MGLWTLTIPLTLVSTLGILLNGYVLLVVIGLGKQMQQQQTANTLLLIHLGAVEAAVCVVLLVFTMGPWPVAGTWCLLHGFLLTLLHPIALWTVTGLNCDRYYAIAAPLHYAGLVSPRRVALGLILSWTGAFLLCLPPFFGLVPQYRYIPGLGCCAPDWGTVGPLYGTAYALLGTVLPAFLVTICNFRVLGIARYHRHRIASAIYEVTLSAQVTITHQRNPFFVPIATAPAAGGPPKLHSAASTVMQLVGSLYLSYFPYCGFILWKVCNGGENEEATGTHQYAHLNVQPRLISLASLLLACSPPINGIIYGLKSRTFRRSVQNYWRKKVTKSELEQEIQARTPSAAGSRRPSGTSGPASFFAYPPLQRRLGEAWITFGCQTGASFSSSNISRIFYRSQLHPTSSCNTLQVPNSEMRGNGLLVRSSTSAVSLIMEHNHKDFDLEKTIGDRSIETSKFNPGILITRTYSEESQEGFSTLLKQYSRSSETSRSLSSSEKHRWYFPYTDNNSYTGSTESCIWMTGVRDESIRCNNLNGSFESNVVSDFWTRDHAFKDTKILEEGEVILSEINRRKKNAKHLENANEELEIIKCETISDEKKQEGQGDEHFRYEI